ncbi:hypothetical protein ACWTQZ_26760, partial [Escherichia coli]
GNVAKTRQEIEVAFADGLEASQRFVEIMTMLGFRFIREVQKTRRPLSLNCRGRAYDIAIDHVPPLGHFLEIELAASDLDREQAEIAVWDLAT